MKKMLFIAVMLIVAVMANAKDVENVVITTDSNMQCTKCDAKVKDDHKCSKGNKSCCKDAKKESCGSKCNKQDKQKSCCKEGKQKSCDSKCKKQDKQESCSKEVQKSCDSKCKKQDKQKSCSKDKKVDATTAATKQGK